MFLTPQGTVDTRDAPDTGPYLTPNLQEGFVLKIEGRDEVIAPVEDLFCHQQQEQEQQDPILDELIDDEEEEEDQEFPEHLSAIERFRKTLYYGGSSLDEMPSSDRFSLPVTELCVEAFARSTSTEAGLHLRKCSNSSIEEHLNRLDMEKASKLSKATCSSPTSLVLALLYLDRLRNRNPTYLRTISSTDLFLVSLMVASKYLNDDGEEDEVFSDEWAKAAGIETKELTLKELQFLDAIDWSLYITQDEFQSMQSKIECEIAKREVKRRGWASYTDLMILTENGMSIWQLTEFLLDCFFKVTTVCSTAYAASLLTMLGTIFVLNKTGLGPTSVQTNLASIYSDSSNSPNKTDDLLTSNNETEATPVLNNKPAHVAISAASFIFNAIEDSNDINDKNDQNVEKSRNFGLNSDKPDLDENGTFLRLSDGLFPSHHTTSVFLQPNHHHDYGIRDLLEKSIKLLSTSGSSRDIEVIRAKRKNQCPIMKDNLFYPFPQLIHNSLSSSNLLPGVA